MRLLLILIALVLVFAAVTLWRAARNEAASEAAYPPSGEIIDVDGTKIKVQTENSVVFLLGLVPREQADRAVAVASEVYGVQKIVKVFEYLN